MEPESSVSLSKINPSDVYKVLKSRQFVDKLLDGMLQDIKNSTAYINLKEIAMSHFASIETSKNDEPIERKKKQTYDVGYLSDCIASTLTKTLHEKLLTFQDNIHATSKAVIDELEMKISDDVTTCSETSLSKQKGSHFIYSSTPNKRNRKRSYDESTDADASPSKRLSNRQKKQNSKYYSENILSSINYSFDGASCES